MTFPGCLNIHFQCSLGVLVCRFSGCVVNGFHISLYLERKSIHLLKLEPKILKHMFVVLMLNHKFMYKH